VELTYWRAKTAPVKGLVPVPGTTFGTGVFPSVVSCPAAGWCVSVGSYWDSSSNIHGLIETLSDGSWSASTAPTAGLNPAPSAEGFTSVACRASGSCDAVGDGVFAVLSGGSWQTGTLPTAGLKPPGQSVYSVNAISCPAVDSCVAFGEYTDTSGLEHGYIAKLAHGTWTDEAAPTGGLKPPPNPTATPLQPPYAQSINSGGIACPTTSFCVAVGNYEDTASAFHGLIESQEPLTAAPVTRWPDSLARR
jgi:hypothetical protein